MIEAIKFRLLAPHALAPSGPQWPALLGAVFALTFASVLVLHLFMPAPEPGWPLLAHALLVACTYCASSALFGACVCLLRRRRIDSLPTGLLWLSSLAVFAIGYFLLPVDSLLPSRLTAEFRHHDGSVAYFLRLLPVWLLLNYLFMQYARPPMRSSQERDQAGAQQRESPAQLVDLGDRAHAQPPAEDVTSAGDAQGAAEPAHIRFEVGRRALELRTDCIASITVEDHYCYLRYLDGTQLRKVDLGLPLHEVLALLPACFVQVHRSHAINAEQVSGIARRGRKTVLLLPGGFEVPVSRHRVAAVLPALEQQLEHGRQRPALVRSSSASSLPQPQLAAPG